MTLPRRIFGIETEYGITCAAIGGGSPPISAEDAAELLFAPITAARQSTNAFLPNGARLYLDVGAHPEYATAECDSLQDLLLNDLAGDAILADLIVKADAQLARKNIAGKLHLLKNNHDAIGNSYGCHENYLIHRRRDYRERIGSLVAFFVTRQILVGSGYLDPGRQNIRPAHFAISQRANKIFDAVSNASTRTRPMINTRDEPHGDAQRYRRMHVIVGDSNMSESTTALKIAMTEAVLNVCSLGLKFPEFELAYPVHAIRQAAQDLDGKALLEMADGRSASALEIQTAYYEFVQEVYAAQGWFSELDELRKYAFDLWYRALQALHSGNHENVANEIEWIAKRKLLDTYRERLSCGYDDFRLARIDFAWHDISTDGLRNSLYASGFLRSIVQDADIVVAKTIPPQTTRAKLRGDFIAAAMDHRRDYFADWQNLKLIHDADPRSVLLQDPFCAFDAQVMEMIEQMEITQ
ncbi:proteasome accessory factor PafA2 family protein [Arcanobacterium hippocoleae]|uniref:Proteasome accessory factor A n=1 Tax=Arcanobacterium hippocoleae TaxID=149017 RepID=A0ABU1T0H7_9ACTO|nr:proteasome accessory factor PafA2 family protein [Arcanobacterium hippocoleae]MDR6938816.1 proteasome accessory factor A [Arcanobacterium hippocoleae]